MRLRRLLLADWQLKLLGVVIAAALWLYVHSERTVQLTLDVPLELFNLPRAMSLVRNPPRTVEVRLEMSRDVIPRLRPKSVIAIVDLARVKGIRADIALSPENIVRPEGVGVLDITPGRLLFEFRPAAGRRNKLETLRKH